jgi:hypothetical protein
MSQDQGINLIIILVAVLILVYLFLSNKQQPQLIVIPEQFNTSSQELEKYYLPGSTGVEDLLVDTAVCHPSCCGDQWPTPFEGLTANEIEQSVSSRSQNGPFVRTGYTCAGGENGVGCPCISKDAYMHLANRGQGTSGTQNIEPTFILRNQSQNGTYQVTPYEQLQTQKSVFVNHPKMNDLKLEHESQDLSNIQSYGAQINY